MSKLKDNEKIERLSGKVASIFEKHGFWDRPHRVRYEVMWGLPVTSKSRVGYTDLRTLVNTLDNSFDNPILANFFQEYNKQKSEDIMLRYLEHYQRRNVHKNPQEAEKARTITSELLKILGGK